MASFRNLSRTILVFAGACFIACTNEVRVTKDLHEPVTIHIVDYGRHAALLIPDEAGVLMKYSYGDWRWYALSDEGVWQVAAALLWPTQGALGRKKGASLSEAREELISLEVESSLVRRLYARLEEAFDAEASSKVYNSHYDLEFVHFSKTYSLAHNSNSRISEWLEDIGCEVKGSRLYSDWRLVVID